MTQIIRLLRIAKKFFFLTFKGNVSYARSLGVEVGQGCRIYIASFGSEPFLIKIGSRVTITSGVQILTHDGSAWLFHEFGKRFYKYAPVTIGDDVFIGVNTIIMPGVSIGSRVIVGAGSVVTRDIPDDTVVAGNPARVITSFSSFEHKVRNNFVNEAELEGIKGYRARILRSLELMERNNGK